MKILIFGMTDNPGGVESFIINYCKEFCGRIKFDFLTYNVRPAYFETIKEMGAKVYTVAGKSQGFLKNRKQLDQFFKDKKNEYDAIWLNLCEMSSIEPLIFAKKYGIKRRIIHSHNTKNMSSRAAAYLHKINKRRIEKYATDFWACSEEAGKFFFSKLSSERVKIINNAVDIGKFMYNSGVREKYRDLLGLSGKFVIGHVGRMHRQKNPFFILEIFQKTLTFNKNAILLWVGTGELFDEIKQRAKEMNIEKSIVFLGKRNDVDCLMQIMDVFLLPSLYEGFPVVLVEAQASGLPCLVSDTVTDQVKILDSCKMLRLQDGPEIWAKNLNDISSIENMRQIGWEKVKNAGYDIKQEAKKVICLLEDDTNEKDNGH